VTTEFLRIGLRVSTRHKPGTAILDGGGTMYRFAQAFPVLPGKSDADAKAIADYFKAHPNEYLESRKAAGITLERAYLQVTPMGSFVVGYTESERDVASIMAAYADTSSALNKKFAELVKEIHGVDVTQPIPGPPPETIGDWRDETVTEIKNGFAFTAPLMPGQAEAGKAFTKEAFVTRRAEFAASRRALTNNAEIVTLLYTPMGPAIAAYLEGEDPAEANRKFAASTSPFDRWFKDGLKKLFPPEVDFDKPVTGVHEIFDSQKLIGKH
jgi:hypothetical protein